MAKAVEREHLVRLGQAHFPRRARIFDAGLRACARAADIAGDQDDIGMRLGHTRRNRANARRTDKLHTDPRARVDLLEVVNQLRQIFD